MALGLTISASEVHESDGHAVGILHRDGVLVGCEPRVSVVSEQEEGGYSREVGEEGRGQGVG